MEKSEIISRLMLLIDLVKLTRGHCSNIENEIESEFSIFLNLYGRGLKRIDSRLKKILKNYCGKDISELSGTALDIFEVTIKKSGIDRDVKERNIEIFQATKDKGAVGRWILPKGLVVEIGDIVQFDDRTGEGVIERRQKGEKEKD